MALSTVTLTWDLADLIQSGVNATITLTPTAVLTDTTDHIVIPQVARSRVFTGGTGSLPGIIACDNSAITPAGWAYTITVTLANGTVLLTETAFINFANGATQDLSALIPVSSAATFSDQVALSLKVQVVRPSGGDDTGLFTAALAALPTTTIYANPGAQSGTSAVVHYGTIVMSAGTFQVGAVSDIGNLGPMVNLLSQGRNATTIAYNGAGDCIRAYNPVLPASDTFDTLAAFHGVINGFTIDGTSAQAGATALHYGDTEGGTLGPDLMIQNFSQGTLATLPTLSLGTTSGTGGTLPSGALFWVVTAVNRCGETVASNTVTATPGSGGTQVLNWTAVTGATGYRIYRGPGSGAGATPNTWVATVGAVTTYTDTGPTVYGSCPPKVNTTGNIGLHLDNAVSWTENIWGRVTIRNCGNAVVMTSSDGTAYNANSFEYNDLTFKIYASAGQNGVVLRNGAFYNNGSLKVRANFADSSSVMSSAALVLTGAYQGAFTQLSNSHLEYQAETNSPLTGGGVNGPMTISFSDPNHNLITGCEGVLSFLPFGSAWTASNYGTASTLKTTFSFDGIVQGDTGLSPANAANPTGIGARTASSGLTNTAGFVPLLSGDSFALTLTGSVTLQLAAASVPCLAGPQGKTIVITQAASGGPFTVAWPSPGSPTLANPTVIWPGGTPPVMSTAASAVDVYRLTTIDGIHWYGSASQAASAALLAANNLSDVATAATALANLAGAPLASPTLTGTVTIPNGSAATSAAARGQLAGTPAGGSPSGCIAQTMPWWAVTAATVAATSGTLYLHAVTLPAGIPVSNITFAIGSTSGTTLTHGWYALVNSALLQVAHTTDQTSGSLAVNSAVTKALVTPYIPAATATYYIGYMVVAGAQPTFCGSGSTQTGSMFVNFPSNGASTTGLTTPGTDGTTSYIAISAAGSPVYGYVS